MADLDLDALRRMFDEEDCTHAGEAWALIDELERTRAERVVLTSAETAAALAGMQARAESAEADTDLWYAEAGKWLGERDRALAAIARVEALLRNWSVLNELVTIEDVRAALRGDHG